MRATKKYDYISMKMFNKKYKHLDMDQAKTVRSEKISNMYNDIISTQMFNKKYILLSDEEKSAVIMDIDARKSYIRNSVIILVDGVAKLISSKPRPTRHMLH